MNSFQHKSQSRETLEKCVCEGGTHCQDLLAVIFFVCDFLFWENFLLNYSSLGVVGII